MNICLLLVKLMQGAMRLTSEGLGKGSEFTFWIPFENSTYEGNFSSLNSSQEQLNEFTGREYNHMTKPPSILLIEDNAINQTVIKYSYLQPCNRVSSNVFVSL